MGKDGRVFLRFDSGKPSFAVSYSPDGTKIAVQTATCLEVRDAGSLQLIHEFEFEPQMGGNPGRPAWSPDGDRIALLTKSGVEIRQVDSGKVLFVGGYADWNGSKFLEFSPDGKRLATMTSGVLVWDLAKATPIPTSFGGLQDVVAFTFSPEGSLIVAQRLEEGPAGTGFRTQICAFDPDTGQRLSQLQIPGCCFTNLLALPGEEGTVVLADEDRVQAWDLRTGLKHPCRTLDDFQPAWIAHAGEPGKVVLVGDGAWRRVAPGSWGMNPGDPAPVRIWDLRTGEFRKAGSFSVPSWRSCATSPDGQYLMLAGVSGLCRVKNATGERLWSGPPAATRYSFMATLEGEELCLLDKAEFYKASLHSPSVPDTVLKMGLTGRRGPVEVPWKCTDRRIETLGRAIEVEEDGSVHQREIDGALGPSLGTWGARIPGRFVSQLVRRGRWIAGSVDVPAMKGRDESHRVGLLDLESGDYSEILTLPTKLVEKLGFSSDSALLTVALAAQPHADDDTVSRFDPIATARPEWGNTIVLWDLRTQREKGRLRGAMTWSGSLVLSGDGNELASIGSELVENINSSERSLQLWSLRSGKQLASRLLQSHPEWGRVNSLFFDRTSTFLAAGSQDKEVTVFRATDLRQVAQWKCPQRSLTWATGYEAAGLLVTWDAAGDFRFLDLVRGDLVLTLRLSTREDSAAPEWICHTPDGRYDGSPGIETRLTWIQGSRSVPGWEWAKGHRKPGLLGQILNHQKRRVPSP